MFSLHATKHTHKHTPTTLTPSPKVCDDDEQTDTWFLGLQSLAGLRNHHHYLTRAQLRLQRAVMKIQFQGKAQRALMANRMLG